MTVPTESIVTPVAASSSTARAGTAWPKRGGDGIRRHGKKIREFQSEQKPSEMVTAHLTNFVSAVQSRKSESLNAEAVEGHLSAICFHAANVSHRLGTLAGPDEIRRSDQ